MDDDRPDLVAIEDAAVAALRARYRPDNFVLGADGQHHNLLGSVPPAGLTVGGEAVSYWVSADGATLIAYTGAPVPNGGSGPAPADKVFTLTVDPDGQSYTFELQQPLDGDATQQLLIGGSSFGSGPANYQTLTTGPNGSGTQVAVASGWDGTWPRVCRLAGRTCRVRHRPQLDQRVGRRLGRQRQQFHHA